MKLPTFQAQQGTSMASAMTTPAQMGQIKARIPVTKRLEGTRSVQGELNLGLQKSRAYQQMGQSVVNLASVSMQIKEANELQAAKAAYSEYNSLMAAYQTQLKIDGHEIDDATGSHLFEIAPQKIKEYDEAIKGQLRDKYRFTMRSAELEWNTKTSSAYSAYNDDIEVYRNGELINQTKAYVQKTLTTSTDITEVNEALDLARATGAMNTHEVEELRHTWTVSDSYKRVSRAIPAASDVQLLGISEALINQTGQFKDMTPAMRNALATDVEASIKGNMSKQLNELFFIEGEEAAKNWLIAQYKAGPDGDSAIAQNMFTAQMSYGASELARLDNLTDDGTELTPSETRVEGYLGVIQEINRESKDPLAMTAYLAQLAAAPLRETQFETNTERKKAIATLSAAVEQLTKFDDTLDDAAKEETTEKLRNTLELAMGIFGPQGASKYIANLRAGGKGVTDSSTNEIHNENVAELQKQYDSHMKATKEVEEQETLAVSNQQVLRKLQSFGDPFFSTDAGKKAWSRFDETEMTAFVDSEDFWDESAGMSMYVHGNALSSKTLKRKVDGALQGYNPEDMRNALKLINDLDRYSPHTVSMFDAVQVQRARFIESKLKGRNLDDTESNIEALTQEFFKKRNIQGEEKASITSKANGEWADMIGDDDPAEFFVGMMEDAKDIAPGTDVTVPTSIVNAYRAEYGSMRLIYDDPTTAHRHSYNNMRANMGISKYGDETVLEMNSPETKMSKGTLKTAEEHRDFNSRQTQHMLDEFKGDTGISLELDDVTRVYLGVKKGEHTWEIRRRFDDGRLGQRLMKTEIDTNGDTWERPFEVTYNVYEKTQTPAEKEVARETSQYWGKTQISRFVNQHPNIKMYDNAIAAITPGEVPSDNPAIIAKHVDLSWRNLSPEKRRAASEQYLAMDKQLRQNMRNPDMRDKDIKWYLFSMGYYTSDDKGSWKKPPGWEYEVAN